MTEPVKPKSPISYDDYIDVRKLVRILWEGKWLIVSITFSGILIAVIIALMLPNIYRAEALLAPNQDEGSGGLSALAAQYGGLASLAGINLSGATSDKTALGLEILKSRIFVSNFIDRHDILVDLFAAKSWNPVTGELNIDSDIYDVSSKKWVREAHLPRTTIPSQQEAQEKFKLETLFVAQDKKSGLVTIAVEHYSPVVAKQWVDWLVQDINATIMHQEVSEAERAIEYLNQQVAATSLAELQNVFFRLIEEQTKTVMLARVTPEYMFRTIDPAVAPEIQARPQRKLFVVLGLFLGSVFGAIAVFLKRGFAKEPD